MALELAQKRWVTEVQFYFGSPPPCMCIYITFAVSDALRGEFEKLVCTFLWASRSVSLMVNEHRKVS